MPSKDKNVLKRANQRYKKSVKGRARINVTKAAWRQTVSGKLSTATSSKKWRQTAEYKAGQATRARVRREGRKAWLREIKSKLCCAECGFNKHPAALQFHHLGNKIGGVTKLVCNTNKSLDDIRKEMAKCVVLCANCHLIYHDKEHEDRVRARDTTRGRLPSLKGNEAPLNQIALAGQRGEHPNSGGSNGKQYVDNKHDHPRGNSSLC